MKTLNNLGPDLDLHCLLNLSGPVLRSFTASRVATVREKYLINQFFSRSENFLDGQGNLEMTWKVRVLLFYVHSKHLRSCRDGQLT